MSSSPRLRFAPSPTGMFHVGGARTALYNWLYARKTGGVFLLRIEDTDEARNKPEWIDGIIEAMAWLGLDWDEGPHLQSAKKPAHATAGQRLFDEGNAYYCDCSQETVKERTNNSPRGYDGFCRDRALEPGEGRALRFRVPAGETVVHDLIRGDVQFANDSIEDFIVVRSSGVPLYMLANVVDDMTDRITHVVRGEEHLPNTPKQILLWTALGGGPVPTYAHLPVIVNDKRQKLSKRRDKVALEMYRDEGYLAEAMRNYLVLLGWAPKGDREVVPLQTMIDEFDFTDVQKSSAFFDVVKLNHFNGEYIRALDGEKFIELARPFLDRADGESWPQGAYDDEKFRAVAPLVQERVARLDEVAPMVDFFFVDEPVFDDSINKVIDNAAAMAVLDDVIVAYAECTWDSASLHAVTLEVGERHGLKLGKAQAPVRLAVTGKKVGPPLFESLEVLGRELTISRLVRLQGVARGARA